MSQGWKRAVLGLIGAASVAAFAGAAAEGAPAPVPVCGSPAGKTLAMGRHARVYSLPLRGPLAERAPEGVRVLGCLTETDQTLRLGRSVSTIGGRDPLNGPVNPDVAAVAAPFGAYSTSFNGIDFNNVHVIVRNLGTGDVLQEPEAEPHGGVEQSSAITDLALRRSGTVAWISQGMFVAGGRKLDQVAYSVPGQEAVILDESKTVDHHSLELHGGLVSWLDGGVRHTAELP